MGKRHASILDTIGHTPVVRINHLGPAHVHLYAKLESFNPMGSVKDRLALGLIEDAERRGELQAGQTIVEATSGNTGIGLAMVCAQKGYPLVVTMAENFSVERRRLMRFLGARVVLTPASLKGSGMVAKAEELALAHGWWQPRQFENPANAETHARTTAQEILEAFDDTALDYWVSGFGTGGTLSGVSRVLRQHSPRTRIVVCEPDNSPLLGSRLPQPRRPDGGAAESHPAFRPHLMQGWSPDFIPRITEEVVEHGRIDTLLSINGNDALRCARELACREGIFVGISAGATLAGALRVAAEAPAGSHILCMLPDTGERYLSTPLFDTVSGDMSEEELVISHSTPGCRFDQPAAPVPTPPATLTTPADQPAADPVASRDIDAMVADPQQPVVMFALEWCEFCWSVRKALRAYGVDYRSIDLDSAAYQAGDRGGQLRAALRARTGWNTFPQIFIAGTFVGGCTDLLDGLRNGSVAERLRAHAVAFDATANADPYTFLPSWLHPR